jgi:hypothetical protein
MKMKKLLATEYASRHKTGMTESEIAVAILSYYNIREATEKFGVIESRLPQTDTNAVRMKTDSVGNAIEKLKKELRQN